MYVVCVWYCCDTVCTAYSLFYYFFLFIVGDEEEETSTTSAAGGAVLPAKSEMMLISQDRKSKFAAAIFMLNGMELGHVIRTMELECPTALEDLDGEAKVEINVNALDSKTFIELEKYVQDKMSETKSPPAVATTTHNNNSGSDDSAAQQEA